MRGSRGPDTHPGDRSIVGSFNSIASAMERSAEHLHRAMRGPAVPSGGRGRRTRLHVLRHGAATARSLTDSGRPASPQRRAALIISGGTLEALKWIGLVLMLLDHVNKVLFHEASATVYALGRMVMPLFAFVLMYKLASPGTLAAGVHMRVMKRLGVFALLASPAFVLLVGWWPLNILATLLVATLMVWLFETGGIARGALAVATFVLGGAWVEFWWPGLLCCLGAWAYCRRPGAARLMMWVLATASLVFINGNFAALAALPLIWGATLVDLPLRRRRWLYYAFYPVHLSALALLHRFV